MQGGAACMCVHTLFLGVRKLVYAITLGVHDLSLQLENKLLFRFVIYMGLWVKFLALIWYQICNKRP